MNSSVPEMIRCFLVRQVGKDQFETGVESRPLRELPAGDVLIAVRRSALNYKDALATAGHPGIAKNFPHVPGIDLAGVVLASESPRFAPGDKVFSTGHELGVERWGGWATHARLPENWVYPLPAGLTFDEIMALGTAGFTAAQCIQALMQHGLSAERGEVLVSGATGGVASLSIAVLAQLGFKVCAVTGKGDQTEWLKALGASRVIDRRQFLEAPRRPLLSAEFAGAIDTVGGEMLETILRRIWHRGCVACCGVAGGGDLHTTVYPFILRGITLCGIDSAWCPDELRPEIWRKLTTEWKPRDLPRLISQVSLTDMGAVAQAMLRGETRGRIVIDVAS